MREANTNLKLRLSSINQEAHQLEIDKLNNKILIKDKEIDLLEKQTISLNSKINGLENFIKNVLEESTKHRQIMEENVLFSLIWRKTVIRNHTKRKVFS